MNNSSVEEQNTIIKTMASGMRDDAWHWRESEVSQFSSEKLRNILRMSEVARGEEDRKALEKVRAELEDRAKQFESNLSQRK